MEDYSHEEVEHVCNTLLDLHLDKLKKPEILFVQQCRAINQCRQLNDYSRRILTGMYDRMQGDQG